MEKEPYGLVNRMSKHSAAVTAAMTAVIRVPNAPTSDTMMARPSATVAADTLPRNGSAPSDTAIGMTIAIASSSQGRIWAPTLMPRVSA